MSVTDTEQEHKKNTRITGNEKRKGIITSHLKHNNVIQSANQHMHAYTHTQTKCVHVLVCRLSDRVKCTV